MNNPKASENLIPWKAGESGNPKGKELGTKNRSTVIRQLFLIASDIPKESYEELKQIMPSLDKKMTVEEVGTLMQIYKMIFEKDSIAYGKLMDSGYGSPTQQIDQTITGQIGIHITDKDAKLGS